VRVGLVLAAEIKNTGGLDNLNFSTMNNVCCLFGLSVVFFLRVFIVIDNGLRTTNDVQREWEM